MLRVNGFRRKEKRMEKTIDERLFELVMRAPHAVRKNMMGPFGRMPGAPECPERPMGRGEGCRPGRGPEFGPGRGPGFGPGKGPEFGHGRGPGFGPGKGPEFGPGRGPGFGPGRGPVRMHGGPKPAFARERLLQVLAGFDGGVRQKALIEEMKVNPSSMSEMISKLEHDGYVKRTVDPEDKRATLISLTELGEARVAELSDERNERFSVLFAKLTEDEKVQLLTLLEKLTAED
jgi:DNA-binding MarR family transcriptional regulator